MQIEFAPFDGDFNFCVSEIVAEMVAFSITNENEQLTNKYVDFYINKLMKANYSNNMIYRMYMKRYNAVKEELINLIPNIFKFFS